MKMLFLLPVFLLGSNQVKEIVYNENLVSKNEISYKENRKLKWDDFTSIDKTDKGYAATACTGFTYSYIGDEKKLKIEVNCIFDKTNSFVVIKHKNDYILNHEQKHFDISYIYSRKFIEELKKEKDLDYKKIDYIYERFWKESQAYQDKYDSETKHSLLKEKQEEWNKIIENQLLNLK